ncbi:MAG: 50S ribosomal protein L23 [Aestuariivita sp.]|nr:50S ribosomal protein L23 [Aestuariivita sp.]
MSVKPEHYDVIRRPIITEKSNQQYAYSTVVFEVPINAAKPEIKEAVEALYGVKVKSINTMIVKGKFKRFGNRTQGYRRSIKKAYVSLQDGHMIDTRKVL